MKFIGKFAIILGAVFLISGILSSLLFFASFDWQNLEESDYFSYLNQNENISIQGINNVKLDFVSEDVYVEKISGSEFVFDLRGYYPKSEEGKYPELKIDEIGDNLNIHVEFPQKRYIFGINSKDSNLYVGVPEKYSGDFIVDVSSGEVFIENVAFSDFEVDAVSGEIELKNLEISGDSIVETSSGNIDIDNLSCENLNVKSVSGEVSLNSLKVEKESYFQTSSGDINIKNLKTDYGWFKSVSGEVSVIDSEGTSFVRTSSGDILLSELKMKNNLDIKSVSGEVDIGFAEESSVDVEFDTMSGNLDNDFGEINDGEYEIFVETSSGNLRVY